MNTHLPQWRFNSGVDINDLDRDTWARRNVEKMLKSLDFNAGPAGSPGPEYTFCAAGNRLVVTMRVGTFIETFDCIITRQMTVDAITGKVI